ncbi:MAG: dTDP-4-dehydrorhamnose 3,5-epimerase, partial [Muribaculaceae bacterium]|nr:dTDP-4-dehydrorhamnose 3,5-epimerase [Muribaculaceae bacterium]
MEFIKTELEGVYLIKPKRFGDHRGYFMETFRQDEFERAVSPVRFIQDNESMSTRGVLRGLHFQRGDASQAKLVRVSEGRVFDVAVDLRRSSPTFGKWFGVELSDENALELFIPRGFAHGFLVLSDNARFQYKVDNYYAPEAEASIMYNDETIGIKWPLSPEE